MAAGGAPMRSRARLAVAAGVVSFAFAGCDGSSDPKGQSGESPRPREDLPEVGDCWTVPAESVFDEQYFVDDSDRVPCSEPHTTETALVARLDEPTVAAAKQLAEGCRTAVINYVGLDRSENWIPWGWTAFMPSKEEIADGAAWLRCEAAFPETWDYRQRSHHHRVRLRARPRHSRRLLGLPRPAAHQDGAAVRPVRPAAQLRADRDAGLPRRARSVPGRRPSSRPRPSDSAAQGCRLSSRASRSPRHGIAPQR